MSLRVLVTGSSGTIGTRLCERLLTEGYGVVGVDWRANKWSVEVQALTRNIDLRDKKRVLQELPANIDVVIHLAANARVYNLVLDPSLARDNFETIFNVLEYVRARNIPRFMFASSREAYGNAGKDMYAEDDVVLSACESPYTASKIGGEALVYSYERCYGIRSVVFRFSNVYGMYDESDRVIPLFIRQALRGAQLHVYGKDKLLDFTYIDDTVDGILAAIDQFEKAAGSTLNLAYGAGTSLVDVARMVQGALQLPERDIAIGGNRTGEVVRYVANIERAHAILGYEPKVAIREGIARSVEWYGNYLYKNIRTTPGEVLTLA